MCVECNGMGYSCRSFILLWLLFLLSTVECYGCYGMLEPSFSAIQSRLLWSITELHMSPLFSSKMCLDSSELGLLYARTKEGNGLHESVQVLPVL